MSLIKDIVSESDDFITILNYLEDNSGKIEDWKDQAKVISAAVHKNIMKLKKWKMTNAPIQVGQNFFYKIEFTTAENDTKWLVFSERADVAEFFESEPSTELINGYS